MAAASKPTKKSLSRGIIAIADAASWWCALVLVAFILVGIFKDGIPISSTDQDYYSHDQLEMLRGGDQGMMFLGGRNIDRRPCDEIYVVGEGETLHTISDKCGDPFIVEQNPHIHDPDDVFPGLVIKITPAAASTSNSIIKNRKLLLR